MQADPLIFRKIYRDMDSRDGSCSLDSHGNVILGYDIVLMPFIWCGGVGVCFSIDQRLRLKDYSMDCVRLISLCFYDDDNRSEADRMYALAHNEVCGATAERIAQTLFWNLFCFYGVAEIIIPDFLKPYTGIKDRPFGDARVLNRDQLIKNLKLGKHFRNERVIPYQERIQ